MILVDEEQMTEHCHDSLLRVNGCILYTTVNWENISSRFALSINTMVKHN